MIQRVRRALSAHLWTVAPRLGARAAAPPSEAWSTGLSDPLRGTVRLTGRLRREGDGETLLLVVHGIGGSADAVYAQRLAAAATRAGISCLRLNLRGCDRLGEDFYHAGLSGDLGVALASPQLAGFRQVVGIGYSIGGHLLLHYAATAQPPRLAALAAVSAPLDLRTAGLAIDRPIRWPYRRYVLGNLLEIYTAVAARHAVPLPVAAARRITHLRQWDDRIVAPRWGFDGVDDYHRRASVAPHLAQLRVPSLLVASEADPMVPPAAIRPAAAAAAGALTVCWTARGGHVGFPADLDLGFSPTPGLEPQLLAWLLAKAGCAPAAERKMHPS